LESSGKMIGFYDLIVAATALERGCAVATFNQRHFAQVPGWQLIQPE
jgi:predicted nucleic acid-binding protein